MTDKNNNKRISNIHIYERLSVVETKIDILTDKVCKSADKNEGEHKEFVSTKVFTGWLASLATAVGIITTVLILLR